MNPRELLPLLRRGDRVAFERFYRATKGALLAYALSWTGGRRSEAEDLVQEAYLGFLRNLEKVREDADPLPYLLTAVKNRARDLARAFSPRTTTGGEPLVEDHGAEFRTPLEQVLDEEVRAAVLAALGRLPEAQAEAVRLHLLVGLGWEQTGAQLGCPSATARTRYREALAKLQRWLGRFVHEQA